MRPSLAALLLVLAAGCGRKAAPPSSMAAPAPEPATTGVVASAVTAAPPSAADLSAVLGELTQALRKYSFEHQQLPKTYEELAAAGYVKNAPAPPAGKKFGIDAKTVRVVVVND